MVTELAVQDISVKAGEDLSADQFRFVVQDLTSKNVRRPDSKTEIPLGILQNDPLNNGEALVRIDGLSKLVIGGVVAVGDFVGAEFVSAADAGKGIKVDAANSWRAGRVVEVYGTAAEDELVGVLLDHPSESKHSLSVSLPAFTANATVRTFLFAVSRPMKITKIELCAYTIPADADGTCLYSMINYDLSATAEDALMSAAFDAEGLVAKTPTEMTLTATAADLILSDGDAVYAVMVNNSAAIDTAWLGAGVTVEYEYIGA